MKQRASDLIEYMDKADCDQQLLLNTYTLFPIINRLFSRWDRIYKNEIKPQLTDRSIEYSLLDVGCGLMDNSLYIQKLAWNDGYTIRVTGVDPNRLVESMMDSSKTDQEFICGYINELPVDRRFDFIISNHLLHHLETHEITALLHDVSIRTNIRAVMNDIHRSWVAYYLFSLVTFPFKFNSYIFTDGRISIRKSFRPTELTELDVDQWVVKKVFPYRCLLVYEKR